MTYMLIKRPFESDTYHFVQPTSVIDKSESTLIETYIKYSINFKNLESVNTEPSNSIAHTYWFKLSDVVLTLQEYYSPHALSNLVKSDYPELLV